MQKDPSISNPIHPSVAEALLLILYYVHPPEASSQV